MMDESGNVLRGVDSSFALNMKNLAWLPGIQTQCTADPNGKYFFMSEGKFKSNAYEKNRSQLGT